MEWLEFESFSREVSQKLTALNASMSVASREPAGARVYRMKVPADTRRWRELMRDWPQHGLWAQWIDSDQ